MPSVGSITIEVTLVRPKVVHKRDHGNPPYLTLCGTRIQPRIPALHLADDAGNVTCKRCLGFLP